LVDRLGQRGVDLRALAYIAGDPEAADRLGGGRTRFGVAFPDGDLGAECGKTRRNAAPDARATTGDNRDAVGQKYI
jgi:hypothetical protein